MRKKKVLSSVLISLLVAFVGAIPFGYGMLWLLAVTDILSYGGGDAAATAGALFFLILTIIGFFLIFIVMLPICYASEKRKAH